VLPRVISARRSIMADLSFDGVLRRHSTVTFRDRKLLVTADLAVP
jgi:hypothetical protein